MNIRKTAPEIFVITLFVVIGWFMISLPASRISEDHIQRENREHKVDNDGLSSQKGESANRRKFDAERYEFLFKMLRDPKTGKIPDNVRERELAYAHLIDRETRHLDSYSTAAASGFSYSQAGPYDIGGRTRALGITNNSNGQPDIYIAGGVSGGVWKSTDAGSTWKLTTSPDQSMSVTSLAEDPRQPNVWYYCGGEFVGNSASDAGIAPYRGGGVYKSTDNGDSWSVLPSTQITDQASYHSVYQYCSKIVVSPTTGSVFVCSNAGVIMRSTNGGSTFTQNFGGINNHYFTNIAVASNGTLIAALSEYGYQQSAQSPPGIFLSTDDGNTWHNITPATFPKSYERTVLAFAPSDSSVAYSFTYTGNKVKGHDDMRFFKYKISGDTATAEDRSANLPEFGGKVGDFQQGNYNMLVAVKPDDPNFVLIGSTNLYRSFDGFATLAYDKSTNWIGGYSTKNDVSTYPGNHPDQHIVVFPPGQPDVAVDGHDGGLSRADNITQQGSGDAVGWTSLNNRYLTSQFYTITMADSAHDDRLLGGTQDNGSPFFRVSSNTGSHSLDISSGDGGYAYLGYRRVYASTQNGSIVQYQYTSGGYITSSGQREVDPSAAQNQLFITPYTIDPNSENVMYYAAGDGLWRNTNLESSTPRSYWGSGPIFTTPDTTLNITALAITRNLPTHTLYMGVSGGDKDSAKVYRLDDAPASDNAVNISSPDFPVGGYISDIAVNPQNGNEFIVVFSNYNVSSLFYTKNGGHSYVQVQGNLQGTLSHNDYIGPSVRSAAIVNTGDGEYFFAGTSVGLYMTTTLNGTSTQWVKQSPGIIGDALVTSLYARPVDGWMAIGTHGRGVFLGKPNTPPSGGGGGGPVVNVPTGVTLNQNYPNPFNPSTKIPFTLGASARITLKIYDLTGKLVSTLLDNASYYAGQYDIPFEPNQLASGTYFYRLTAVTKDQKFTKVKKMTLIR